jgi:hypothetical protein
MTIKRKSRKQESIQFMVKWIVGNTMYFRAYKRDSAAVKFQDYLINAEGVDPAMIRIVMR